MDQYLNNFPGKKLVSFDVTFTFKVGHVDLASNLDNWISFAVRMEAERINFNVSSWSPNYNFPCHLLPPGGVSPLKFLCLQRCKLSLPLELADRFGSLESLELVDVMLEEKDVDAILCCCINLESLTLRKCLAGWSVRLESHHVPKLKFVSLQYSLNYYMQNNEVNAVGFERFEYRCLGDLECRGHPPQAKSFLWFSNPVEMPMDYNHRSFHFRSTKTLFWFKDPVVALPASMSAFGCVKNLHLVVPLTSKFDILAVTCIMDAFPVLEKFHLTALHESSRRDEIPKKKYSNRQYPQLQEVKISGFRDRCNVVQLAIHLLNNAVALEKMIIYRRSKKYDDAGEWEEISNYGELMRVDEVNGFLFKEKVNPKTRLLIV